MHPRHFTLLSGSVLALGLSLAPRARAADASCGGLFSTSAAQCSRLNVAATDAPVATNGDAMAAFGCSVSPRVRLMRTAGTMSIITTTFAVLGALFILRRRRF